MLKFLNTGGKKQLDPPAPKSVKFASLVPVSKFNYVGTRKVNEINETKFYGNNSNRSSVEYLKELCVIEMTRLKFFGFENFRNSLDQDQLILYHETLTKTGKTTKNSKNCRLL